MSAYVIGPGDGRSILNNFVIFKLAGEQTGQNLAIVEHVLAPGELGAPLHTHGREDEYSFVIAGEMTVLIGDELATAQPGSLVLKPRGIAHTFMNRGESPLRLLEIISPGGFERYFDELAQLFAAGHGQPDPAALLGLARRYELQMDMSSLATIIPRYGVRLPGTPAQPAGHGQPA